MYGEGEDTFTMTWKVEAPGKNSWRMVDGTGKYRGISGSGTTKTRVASKFLKLPHRVSDWEGVISLPEKN